MSNDNTKSTPIISREAQRVTKRVKLMHNERRRYGYALTDRDRHWLVSIHNICTQTDCECDHYHIFEKAANDGLS